MEDMEHINRDLLDSSIPQEQKFKDMQEFVLSSIRKFKRKVCFYLSRMKK